MGLKAASRTILNMRKAEYRLRLKGTEAQQEQILDRIDSFFIDLEHEYPKTLQVET